MDDDLPVMSAAEIACIYRRVVAGEGRISRPVAAGGLTVIDVDGARVCVAFGLDGVAARTLWATAPGCAEWSWGCERDWVALGPAVEPLDDVDRWALGERLRGMTAPLLDGEMGWPDFERVAMRQRNAVVSVGRKQQKGK